LDLVEEASLELNNEKLCDIYIYIYICLNYFLTIFTTTLHYYR